MEIVNMSQIKNLMGLSRHWGKQEWEGMGLRRKGGWFCLMGGKGCGKIKPSPCTQGRGTRCSGSGSGKCNYSP